VSVNDASPDRAALDASAGVRAEAPQPPVAGMFDLARMEPVPAGWWWAHAMVDVAIMSAYFAPRAG
jgi:hypothetical protein